MWFRVLIRASIASALLLLCVFGFAQTRSGKVHVFILAGQSNMEGQGLVTAKDKDGREKPGTLTAMLADPKKAPLLRHLRTRDGKWVERDDIWVYDVNENGVAKGPLGFGYGWNLRNKDWFGPELQFGHVVKSKIDDPVLIIKTAWGGRSLYGEFRPPSSGGKVGAYYTEMVDAVRRVLANLKTEFPQYDGRGYQLDGFVWWHGWNDHVDRKKGIPEYEENLANLIRDLRRDLGAPKLPVVIGEFTGPWNADCTDPGALSIRGAQATVAASPEFRDNAIYVPTHDFVRTEKESPTNEGYHEFKNGETYFLIGDALGRGALALLRGKRSLPPVENKIRDYGVRPYVRVSHALPHRESKPWKLVCKLPYNCQFQPSIAVDSPGATIAFDSTNPLVRYLTPTESVAVRPGRHTVEASKWVSGEGAVYSIPAGVEVRSVAYRETGVDTAFAGSFTCNDEDFNILWRRAARTAYLCMRDHFYDCPDRERVGFWGDGTPELDQCFYLFDRRSDWIARDLVCRSLEPKFYPGQHLEFLGEYGLWFYYLHTGDLASISKVYDATKTFLFSTYKTGNRNTWFDWGKDSKDTSVIETCFLYIDLGTLRKIAAATGRGSDVKEIDARREEIRKSFDAKFWRGSHYQSSDVLAPDDRANAMAIDAGLADRSKWGSIHDRVLMTTTNSSCFFDRWVFEALCKMGRADDALLRMSTRYRTMIESDFSTLWEHYDRWWASWLNAFDDASSLNHGWNPPAILLAKEIAGVRPTEPGWTTFEVMPQEAFLTSLRLDVPSIRGHVIVDLKKTASEYRLELSSPRNTTAIVGIPRTSFRRLDRISVNGVVIWEGHGREGVLGVKGAPDADGYVRFRVPAGRWSFVATGELVVSNAKSPRRPAVAQEQLDSRGWTATASVRDGSFAFSGAKIPVDVSAANAIDGDGWTGWRDLTRTQYPGQWFQIDMHRGESFDRIVLDNTWALYDSPHRYEVTVSDDGTHWSAPIATGFGTLGITMIDVGRRRARFIRVTQTGSDATYHWSIYELKLFRSGR